MVVRNPHHAQDRVLVDRRVVAEPVRRNVPAQLREVRPVGRQRGRARERERVTGRQHASVGEVHDLDTGVARDDQARSIAGVVDTDDRTAGIKWGSDLGAGPEPEEHDDSGRARGGDLEAIRAGRSPGDVSAADHAARLIRPGRVRRDAGHPLPFAADPTLQARGAAGAIETSGAARPRGLNPTP